MSLSLSLSVSLIQRLMLMSVLGEDVTLSLEMIERWSLSVLAGELTGVSMPVDAPLSGGLSIYVLSLIFMNALYNAYSDYLERMYDQSWDLTHVDPPYSEDMTIKVLEWLELDLEPD